MESEKKKPWGVQKELQKQEIPTPGDIRVIAGNIKDLRVRALFIMLYLTAGRISEVCYDLKKKDLELVHKRGRDVLLIKLKNLKNRTRKFKTIPVPLDKELELIQMLNEYLGTVHEDEPLFDFGKIRAHQLLMKHVGFNNHWLRHVRLTHLTAYYDFPDQLLVRFAGWSDSRPAKSYSELRWSDILDKY